MSPKRSSVVSLKLPSPVMNRAFNVKYGKDFIDDSIAVDMDWEEQAGHEEVVSDEDSHVTTEDHLSLLDPYFDLTRLQMVQLFHSFDVKEESGCVSYEDFRKGLQALGIECAKDSTFESFIKMIDVDSSNGISLDEFQKAVQIIKMDDLFKKSTMDEIYRLAASDGKGSSESSRNAVKSKLQYVDYSAQKKIMVSPVKEMKGFMYSTKAPWAKTRWVCMEGIDPLNIRRLAIKYRLHPLALEDTLQSGRQRPKLEEYEEHGFLIVPMVVAKNKKKLKWYGRFYQRSLFQKTRVVQKDDRQKAKADGLSHDEIKKRLHAIRNGIMYEPQQLSVFIMKSTIISVQEFHTDLWDTLNRRLQESYSKERQNDASFLVYAIVDTVVDELAPIALAFGGELLLLEMLLHKEMGKFNVRQLESIKHGMTSLSRTIKPLEKIVQQFIHASDDTPHVRSLL